MKELTINDIQTIAHRDESRILEVKKTTGELVAGMQSGCAFLNTEGGWLFFGIHPKTLNILGQDIAKEMRKFSPAIDLYAQYVDVPGRPNQKVIAIWFPAPAVMAAPYTYDSRPYYKVENTTSIMPREMFDERIRLSDPKKFSWGLTPCLSGDKVNDNRNDRPNDSRIDRLSDSVKKTYQIIKDNPGIQRKRISDLADKSIPTIDRHLAVLVKEDLIEHRDSDRNGGYYAK